jgi:hypothetical protein
MGERLMQSQKNGPPGVLVSWGRPDSPQRPLCSICHGALPGVPLGMWKADGSGAQFCDKCVATWLEVSTEH